MSNDRCNVIKELPDAFPVQSSTTHLWGCFSTFFIEGEHQTRIIKLQKDGLVLARESEDTTYSSTPPDPSGYTSSVSFARSTKQATQSVNFQIFILQKKYQTQSEAELDAICQSNFRERSVSDCGLLHPYCWFGFSFTHGALTGTETKDVSCQFHHRQTTPGESSPEPTPQETGGKELTPELPSHEPGTQEPTPLDASELPREAVPEVLPEPKPEPFTEPLVDNSPPDTKPIPITYWAASATGNGKESLNAVTVDSVGNVIVTGDFDGELSFGTTQLKAAGARDLFVAKLAPNGRWLWAKSAGASGEDRGKAIAVDAKDNIYVTGAYVGRVTFGTTSLQATGFSAAYIARLDPQGNWGWAISVGGTGSVLGSGIVVDSKDNVIVTGHLLTDITFGNQTINAQGGFDVFVASYSPANTTWNWFKTAGGPERDRGLCVSLDAQDNVYVGGSFAGKAGFGATTLLSAGLDDGFVAGLTSSGAWRWALAGGGIGTDFVRGIATAANGNSYVVGSIRNKASFGTTNLLHKGDFDIFVASVSNAGAWSWVVSTGEFFTDNGYGIGLDKKGHIFVSGEFQRTVSFGLTNTASNGLSDVFIAKLDLTGKWLWATSGGGTPFDYSYGLAVGPTGVPVLIGNFSRTMTLGTTTLKPLKEGERDVFVWQVQPGP